MRHLSRLLLTLLLTSLPLQAQIDIPDLEKTKATFHTEVVSVAPGDRFHVALELDLPRNWHSYYLNSGGLELPLRLEWDLPEGFTHGPILWPPPEVKDGYFGKSFIYTGKPVFLVEITTPDDLEVGPKVELEARARWQICKESCKDEGMSWSSSLPTSEQPQPYPGIQEFFAEALAALPEPLPEDSFTLTDGTDGLTLEISGADRLEGKVVDFIPDQAFVLSISSGGSIEQSGDTLSLQLPTTTENALGEPIEPVDSVSGIVLLEDGSGYRLPLTPIAPAEAVAATAPPSAEAAGFGTMLSILGGMFLGGLILNLMPCVFPVIGLKIMGFVQQAGEDRKKVMLHGVTFSIGVVISFAVLSTLLFLFKESFGWGDQLGKPWFVLPMMILIFLLGLNMFGVFEIGASATSIGGKLQAKEGYSGSFFSGALATLIATPCSAPFLGTAIGAAIGLPAVQFFASFGAMALGLSAPYLILSAFPKLIEALPRPGAWMESFKQAMSFLLFGTAGFLLWVYIDLVDMQEMTWPYPVFGLTLIALAAWIHGRWNLPSRSKRARGIAMAFIALFACSGFLLAMPPATPDPADESKPTLTWKTWSPEKVEELLAEGTPVYIDFTAKWCATCNVNKGRAYPERVVERMNSLGVVTLKADKTKPNPEIETAIRDYGRAAIPVNVLLIPGKDPIILPELLSPGDVMEALSRIESE